jgi:hypothetical protein
MDWEVENKNKNYRFNVNMQKYYLFCNSSWLFVFPPPLHLRSLFMISCKMITFLQKKKLVLGMIVELKKISSY